MQLVVLVSARFRDGQYSLVSFLFAVLLITVLPSPLPVPYGVGATVRATLGCNGHTALRWCRLFVDVLTRRMHVQHARGWSIDACVVLHPMELDCLAAPELNAATEDKY